MYSVLARDLKMALFLKQRIVNSLVTQRKFVVCKIRILIQIEYEAEFKQDQNFT